MSPAQEEELLDEICRQIGTTLDYLRQNPGGYFWEKREYGRHERVGFDTESGKVELYSEKLKRYGHDPLPTYIEPAESPMAHLTWRKTIPLS